MRMWLVDPAVMCRRHLLGEHVELHMFVGHLALGRGIDGFVHGNLLETATIKRRHEELVTEMRRRGYQHNSPLIYQDRARAGKIDRQAALTELLRRCPDCQERHAETTTNQ